MSLGLPKAILVLDGAPPLPSLDDSIAHHAGGPLEAAALVARLRPELMVIHADVAWHRTFVETLPAHRRPAVLGVGGRNARAALIDDWVKGIPEPEELCLRLRMALERARYRRQNARRVFSDVLTGLPNRRAVVRNIVREAARARRAGGGLVLVLLDLDGFKAVNDERGHQEGDRLLRKVGRALQRAVRGGELCGRIGGDEFALVLSGELRDGNRAARRLVEAVRSAGISATAAVGVLRDDEGLRGLYRRTDALLRESKRRRRLFRIPQSVIPAAHVIDESRSKQRGLPSELHAQATSPGAWTRNQGGRIELHQRDDRQDSVG